ncbi:methyl-accepting chemotaxis protein [Herminiimonas sp. NPDC097707]|uniref:methyl-accepting chemotaxis protein n=1 Tax=Herminiimonas sp. NPDC097707 TaxID=3364007 RepID=UPI00383A1209
MKSWTIKQRILGSFAVILTLMAAMAAVAWFKLANINDEAISLRDDSTPGLYYSTMINAAWNENLMLSQQILESQNGVGEARGYVEKLRQNSKRLDQLQAGYLRTIFDDADQQRFDSFIQERAKYEVLQQDMLRQAAQQTPQQNRALFEKLFTVWQACKTISEKTVETNKTFADRSSVGILASVSQAQMTMLAVFFIALSAALICGLSLMRAITLPMQRLLNILELMRSGDFSQRLNLERKDEFSHLAAGFNRMTDELTALVGQAQKSSGQVSSSITEIAATSKQQQATAAETAATTTEIGATSREIFATSRDLVRTMNEVSLVSEQTATLAGSGQVGLTRMENTMQAVMDAAGSVSGKLAILNEKAGNINQVVTTITKVADQTNLLSLNAAIEAEKAGEYGRGFSVVATEIRRLADQTAVATYDIELMVKEIQSAVAAGVMGMDKFSDQVRRGMQEVQQVGSQLSQIIAQVQALAPQFQTVNEGMQAQANSAEQINQALAQLSEAAQQTVESLHQSSQAIDELHLVSNGLRNGVSRFKVTG